jgi:DNA-binding transcriptional LysR family regulator
VGLDLSLLETFRLVADLGSFSAAARKLGLTQPAISFQIKSLERELAAPLIDRSGGKVVLTPAGRTAYDHALRLLFDRDVMLADIPRATGKTAGHLLVGAGTIPGEFLLPHCIAEFRTVYPKVTVSVDIADSTHIMEELANEEIEVGFVGSPSEDPAVVQRRFSEDHLVLITPPHHRLAGKKEVSMEDITGEVFVNRKEGSGTRIRVESAMRDLGLDGGNLDIAAELGSTHSVISAVASGLGVSLISNRAAELPSISGMIAMKKVSGVDLSREFYAIHSSLRPLSVAAEKFLEFCVG